MHREPHHTQQPSSRHERSSRSSGERISSRSSGGVSVSSRNSASHSPTRKGERLSHRPDREPAHRPRSSHHPAPNHPPVLDHPPIMDYPPSVSRSSRPTHESRSSRPTHESHSSRPSSGTHSSRPSSGNHSSRPSSDTRSARPRSRTAETNVTTRRSVSLPVDALQEDFPQGGRTRPTFRRQQSAPGGDMIPLIRSAMRVATQFLSLKTKGLTQDLTQHKRVEFAFLEVREYPIILGDNPSAMEGPPITIDWGHDPSTQFVLDVNSFEKMRGTRRKSADLVLPRAIRERWLVNCGTTEKEMAEVIRQCRKDKHSRAVSCSNAGYDPVSESIEKLSSGLKNMFSFKKSPYEKALQAVVAPASGRPGQNMIPCS